MKKIISVFICSFLYANSALGLAWTSEYLMIESMVVEQNHILVYTTGGGVYATGCLANNWFITGSDDAELNRLLSTLMTAMASKKKIKFWYEDDCGSWDYHKSSSVKIFAD